MTQGWNVDEVADTITFDTPPPAGTNNIVVTQYATATFNATPIFAMGAWNGEYGFPGEVEFYSDRLAFAATDAQPQTLWLSRIGDYSMFGKSTPILDDDAIIATMNARQLNQVVDLIPKQHLLALTTGSVWKIGGGSGEVLTPSTINAKPQPSAGAANLPALDAGDTALYLTRNGRQVRDLAFTFEADGYAGSDLTAFASHLLDHRSLVDWCYANVPYSIVVAVGDDGVLLTMTYKREHQVVAWAWHDTDGVIESVCTIPEDGHDAIYVVVKRTVTGIETRYIERFCRTAALEDLREECGVDCALSYDGRNTTTTALLITGGGGTGSDPAALLLAVTATAATFQAGDVGDDLIIGYTADDASTFRIGITEYVSATVVRGYATAPVLGPAFAAGTDWAIARDTFAGLDHLEALDVSIAGDGQDYGITSVATGIVTISPPAALVHIGLPFTSEFESLDMVIAGGEAVGTRQKIVREVGVLVKDTRGLEIGCDFDHLETLKPRDSESMVQAPRARTEWIQLPVPGQWQQNPRVCIRNASPIRHTILAIEPNVEFGR